MTPEPSKLTPVQKTLIKLPLYTKIGWGLLILFGIVGNLSGHSEGSSLVFVFTAVVWTCMRILAEAIESWRVLRFVSAIEKIADEAQRKAKGDDADPPAPPGTAA